jgi:hypothetical protein
VSIVGGAILRHTSLWQNDTGHAGGASDPTIIQDANAASRAPGGSDAPFSIGNSVPSHFDEHRSALVSAKLERIP